MNGDILVCEGKVGVCRIGVKESEEYLIDSLLDNEQPA